MFKPKRVYFQCGWYWGPLGWNDAEDKLSDKPDGSFLVRDSSDDRYILSLSFRSQNATHHTRIEHYKGEKMYGDLKFVRVVFIVFSTVFLSSGFL